MRRVTLWLVALAGVVFAYSIVADRLAPSTSDAHVTAFLVRVAPEVSGRIVEVAVSDNQGVEAGAPLFRIDPQPYEIAVARAEARLASAGQGLGVNTASVQTAQARLAAATANRDNVQDQAARALELVRRGVYSEARADQANEALREADAAVAAAEAELQGARQALGPEGRDNPQIIDASEALREAQLNLLRTTVAAPGNGVITNLQATPGQFAAAGQGVMTFIDARAIWVTALMRENSLEHVRPGTAAEVVFDALPGRVFPARVESTGWGVGGTAATDAATGLPAARASGSKPPRFPVQFVLETEELPRNLRYGSQATLVVYAGGVRLTDLIGAGWIRAVSVLTYLS